MVGPMGGAFAPVTTFKAVPITGSNVGAFPSKLPLLSTLNRVHSGAAGATWVPGNFGATSPAVSPAGGLMLAAEK